MSVPTANDDGAAIAFGQRILALPDTGSFTASYKYAVLLAVLDAALEHATVERVRMQHPDAFAVHEGTAVATVVRYPIPLLQRIGVGGRAVERPFVYTYGWRVGVGASTVHSDRFDDRVHLIDDAGTHLAALVGLSRPVIEREWSHGVWITRSALT